MSSPVCLSTVLVLRCIGISREESALLLIPAGLEMVFSIGILVAGRGQGRRRFIIALEGLIYVFLAVLDVFTHLVSTFQSSLQSFKVLDIIIGTASFIPLLLFTSFLYLFKRAEFFPAFPKRFTFVASFFAVIAIPVLLVTSEIGSFIGNDYVTVQFDTIPPSPPQFAVGTTNQAAEVARLFFSSLALALMAAYAVITFLIFFVRLSASFVNQRRIEDDGESQEETYLFKGTGWIALGLTFAAAESLAGFATGSFGLFFTRRILRMLSRACIAIGVVKGPDRRLKFDMLDNEKRGSRRKSTMRLKIGAPLLVDSTRRISQLLGIDLTKRRDSVQSDTVVGTAPFGAGFPRPSDDAYPGGSQFPMPYAMSPTNSSQRVTIFMRHGRAPTLLLRLSDPGLPSPNAMFRHSPSNRSSSSSIRQGHADADLTIEETVRTRPGSRSSIYSAGKSLEENFRTQAYRNMKGGLPSNPRVGSASNSEYGGLQMPIAVPVREARVSFLDRPLQRLENMLPSPTGSAIPRRTSKRKAPPPVRASMYNDSADFVSPVSPREVIEFPRVPDSARRRMHSTTSSSSLGRVRGARDSRDLYQSPDTATSPRRSSAVPRSQRSRPTTTSAVSAVLVDPARAHSLSGRRSADHVRPASLAESPEDHRSALARGSEAISFDWLTDPEGQNGAEEWATRSTEASSGHARSSSQVLHSMPSLRSTPARTQTQRQSPRRNVSFGVVSRRQTPTPSPAAITRASVDVERLTSEMDASSFNNASSQHDEYRDTSESTSMADSASISSWGPQRDSEVLTLNPSQLMERYGEAA